MNIDGSLGVRLTILAMGYPFKGYLRALLKMPI